MNSAKRPRGLPVPPDAIDNDEAVEVLRAFVVGNGLSISYLRAFDDPAMGGMMPVDIARHGARAFEMNGVMNESEAMAEIVGIFEAELARPTDLGVTKDFGKGRH